MSKTKTVETSLADQIQNVATTAGLALMASAAVLGMVELTDGKERILPVAQPVFAFAGDNKANNPNDTLRREREEEVGSHFVSYGVSQRTPSNAGKR